MVMLDTPQLDMSFFSRHKQNESLFNRVYRATSNNMRLERNLCANLPFGLTLTKLHDIKHITNHYFPLSLYLTVSGASNTLYARVRTHNYYCVLNTLSTLKYQNFFIFFMLQFLENLLHKKIWVKISMSDPLKPT